MTFLASRHLGWEDLGEGCTDEVKYRNKVTSHELLLKTLDTAHVYLYLHLYTITNDLNIHCNIVHQTKIR